MKKEKEGDGRMTKKLFWKKYTIGEMLKIGLFQLMFGFMFFLPLVLLVGVVGTATNTANWIIGIFAMFGAVIFFAFVQFAWVEYIRHALEGNKPKDREMFIIDKKRRDPIILKL